MFSDNEAKSWLPGTKGRTWLRKQSIYFYVCTLTFLSKSLSHMSLIVHPAPLISKAPTPKSASMRRSGRHPGSAASPILQVQGRYSSHVPTRTQWFIFHWKQKLATKRTSWKTTPFHMSSAHLWVCPVSLIWGRAERTPGLRLQSQQEWGWRTFCHGCDLPGKEAMLSVCDRHFC